ncbi:hypothetical protein C7N43_00380 [Sphingobacteriales bacterium UPWRP_1]|nr:hypothetical protein BVG80_15310 [Sphingobacteriales bacterium TSM_CSM]PSJ79115.1 hypothetical protein C7N43_00380 [Sphingobacteriales bacterium UPWRP_1]
MPIKNTNDILKMPAEYKAFKKRLPRFVGTLAVNFFKENFTRQGFADEPFVKWKGRKQYIKEGAKVEMHGRASLLIKTGALRRSIRIVQTAANKVSVGTILPYAQIHNEGGTIVQKPTFKQRMYFSYLSEEAYKSGNTSTGNMYAAFSTAKKLNIIIPQRKFIGNSTGLNKRIARQIHAWLKEILRA